MMKIEKVRKESFTVIGKGGSTTDGDGFIRKLWEDANAHFGEIAHLAKKEADGTLAGVWGAMSDFSRSFLPWEDYRSGLYLAGAECLDGAEAPDGWTKWVIPGYEYLRVENDGENVFSQMIAYLEANHFPLAGAVHEYTCPRTGKEYLFFPIRRL